MIRRPDPTPGAFPLSITIRQNPATLREEIVVDEANARLEEIGALRSLSALTEKVTLLRLLGRLDEAWDTANEAVRRTRFGGDRAELVGARIQRAQVMLARGKVDEALSELSLCVDESRTHEWAEQNATALYQRGVLRFEVGDFETASRDFDAAVALSERLGDPDGAHRARTAFTAAAELHEQSERDALPDLPARGRRRAD